MSAASILEVEDANFFSPLRRPQSGSNSRRKDIIGGPNCRLSGSSIRIASSPFGITVHQDFPSLRARCEDFSQLTQNIPANRPALTSSNMPTALELVAFFLERLNQRVLSWHADPIINYVIRRVGEDAGLCRW